jgi:hypothetical protein
MMVEPAQISSGLTPDRHPALGPLWAEAENVRFYQGKVRRLLPAAVMAGVLNAAEKLRGIHQQQNSNGTRWLWWAVNDAGTITFRRWYGPVVEDIGTQAATVLDDTVLARATQVDFQAWGNWTLINTGIGPIRWYQPDEAVPLTDLPNAPTDVVAIMKKQNQLLAIGTGLTKRGVAWSDADDITDWIATATNLAGSLTIEELQSPIRAAARLGNNIACYSEDQMALVYWIGAPFYYGQRVALDGIGAVSKTAVCSDGRLNYGVSRNGIWQTDGNDYNYIDQGILSDHIQRTVNWEQAGKILAARNDVTRCVEFHFPILGSGSNEATEAWSYDPSTGGWAPVPAYQSMAERQAFDKPLGGKDGQVLLLDNDPAAEAKLRLVTKPMLIDTDIPGLHLDAIVDEVEIAALRASNVRFRLENAVDIDGPWEPSDWHELSADLQTYRLAHLPSGTFHRLLFESTLANWDLDLQGFAFFGQIEGVKRDEI